MRDRKWRFSRTLPAVGMAHGFSATITMTIDHYAETICSDGSHAS